MAPLSNYIISFLFFTTLLFPLQIIARDSQFFSKFTHFNNKDTEVVPKKELPVTNMPQEQQQPSFITETENSYGLYGHDSETENNNKYYNNDVYNTKDHNKDVFVNNQNELSDTKFTEEGRYNNAANERYYHNNKNNYNGVVNNDMYNGEKQQGMSDTRFLEGGKYFYDLNYEKYSPTIYDDSSRGFYNNRRNNNAYQNHGNHNVYQNQEEFEDEQNEFEP